MKKIAPFLILLAGTFWGSMGIFVKALKSFGLDSIQTSFFRLSTATIILFVYILIKDKSLLKIKLKDLPLLLAIGVFSMLLMSCSYFTTIYLTSMSVAAILLYTAPIFVMIMSVIFLKEKITFQKIIALILAFIGCVLVAGIGSVKVTFFGIITGICSGIAYALYSIFGTFALKKHKPFTITFYAFLFATIGSVFISHPVQAIQTIVSSNITTHILVSFLTGLISAVLPFVLYTTGLKYIEASKASILACIEPLVATLFGVFIYKEPLNIFSILGIVSIFIAILILNNFGITKEHSNKQKPAN